MMVITFAVTIAVLDFVFRRSAEQAARDLLEIQVFALIGAAMPDAEGELMIPLSQLDPRLRQPGSGLYAEIRDGDGSLLWRSPSAVGLSLGASVDLGAGRQYFARRVLADGQAALVIGLGISWELGPDLSPAFSVFAAEDLAPYERQLATFRRQLSGWFTAVMLLLLGALWLALRAGLGPLRRMRREIAAVQAGRLPALGERYPRELAGVTQALNALLSAERRRMQRYRNSLADLAHSLKTPLAVARTELEAGQPDRGRLVAEVERMQAAVDWQLRRAAATGPSTLSPQAVSLAPVAESIAASLDRLHAARGIRSRLDIPPGLSCLVEEGDLYELLGNLMDNAWKWARGEVEVSALRSPSGLLRITVADDGPGIPGSQRDRVLVRGVRIDQSGVPAGHGIGLAVVREIVDLYQGELAIGRSPAGGTSITVEIPAQR
ncbi:MAG: hypothetical protein JJT85_00610 [Chromatiales bacterium]|nr:hypothetical protein [Chromatiales bacterium]